MKQGFNINLPNILTLSRIILGAIFLALFLYANLTQQFVINKFIIEFISMIIFIAAITTDGLDGYFARKNNKITEFGQHFDPLSDSILFILVFLSFVLIKLMPVYFFILIFIRECFMHFYLRPYYNHKGMYLPANIFGKIKTFFQAMFSVMILCGILGKEILIIYFNDSVILKIYNSIFNITTYIFFALITFLSLFSITIYIFHFIKSFFKKNT